MELLLALAVLLGALSCK
uniref:Uncharacterized protein n=1 Tax=Anguilla anguilla TaxID=7936 RepID=A0A0E9UKM8_ANGAN